MRCSLVGATVEQVKSAGGRDIREARLVGVVFASLTAEQVVSIRLMGARVEAVRHTSPASPEVSPPLPVAAVPIYGRHRKSTEIEGCHDI